LEEGLFLDGAALSDGAINGGDDCFFISFEGAGSLFEFPGKEFPKRAELFERFFYVGEVYLVAADVPAKEDLEQRGRPVTIHTLSDFPAYPAFGQQSIEERES
jgi:hypothetical protein